MLPKTHILLGAVFTILIWMSFSSSYGYAMLHDSFLFYLLIIFLSSFLIDVDHYIYYVFKKRDISLRNAYNWFIEHRVDSPKPFMFSFHSIEFLLILAILSFYFNIFFLIFVGFTFHVIIDICITNTFYFRGHSFLFYLIVRRKNGNKK